MNKPLNKSKLDKQEIPVKSIYSFPISNNDFIFLIKSHDKFFKTHTFEEFKINETNKNILLPTPADIKSVKNVLYEGSLHTFISVNNKLLVITGLYIHPKTFCIQKKILNYSTVNSNDLDVLHTATLKAIRKQDKVSDAIKKKQKEEKEIDAFVNGLGQ